MLEFWKLWNKLLSKSVAKSVAWLHRVRLMKNETIVCGETQYLLNEFLGFPNEWISDMLRTDGLNQFDIDLTIVFIDELRSEWAKLNG